MINIITKKKSRELKKPRFQPPSNVPHETEIAARELQNKLSQNQVLGEVNNNLRLLNEGLENKQKQLRFEATQEELKLEKTKKNLLFIDQLIGIRNKTLQNINDVLVKISNQHGTALVKFIQESKKLEKLLEQYEQASVQYAELNQKNKELEKKRKQEEAIIVKTKQESSEIGKENKRKKSEYESYKTRESEAITKMRFYGDRINRFYESRQMKPPIELPF